MVFFHGLDNGSYADFNVNFLNGLQVKSIMNPPKDWNTSFTLANNWLKPKVLTGRGYGSTYATRLDAIEKKREEDKKKRKKKIEGNKQVQTKQRKQMMKMIEGPKARNNRASKAKGGRKGLNVLSVGMNIMYLPAHKVSGRKR
jgi:hypothetical protein